MTGVDSELLRLDAPKETERICASIQTIVFDDLKRRGAVVGVSGGIDSAVVAFLCARALGSGRVRFLFMPESDSSPDSLRLGQLVADALGAKADLEVITPILAGARCYERRDEAVRSVCPEYGPGCKFKIVLPNLTSDPQYSLFSLVVGFPDGSSRKMRLTAPAYLAILAATNAKQRVRKMLEYQYADLLQYAVAGTPNLLEHDQGFFVKNGDGSADFKPIAHLYKSQVYQLAAYLGVPEEIQRRLPTTDTYSLEQTQEEFYFMLPYQQMDLCLYGRNAGMPAGEVAQLAGLTAAQVERMYGVIDSKRKVAKYLHAPALMV